VLHKFADNDFAKAVDKRSVLGPFKSWHEYSTDSD